MRVIDRSLRSYFAVRWTNVWANEKQFQLSNGIKVYYVENPSLQLLRIRVVTRSGADRETIPGLARLTMSVMTKGTTSRSAQQIAEELEFLGASLGSSATWDYCVVSLMTLPEFGDAALSVFAEVIQGPTFPQAEIDRLRTNFPEGLSAILCVDFLSR